MHALNTIVYKQQDIVNKQHGKIRKRQQTRRNPDANNEINYITGSVDLLIEKILAVSCSLKD
jgi:hypothetical protein